MADSDGQVMDTPSDALSNRVRFLIFTGCVCILQLISGNAPTYGVSNWLIPDGQTYSDVMNVVTSDGIGSMWKVLPEQFTGIPTNPLLFVYYFPFSLVFGVVGYFIANQVLVWGIAKPGTILGMILTPYFLLSFVLPSKDLLVLALFVPFLSVLYRRNYVASIMVALAIFLVRDGAGVVALACMGATAFAPKSSRYRVAMIVVGVLALALLNSLVYDFLGNAFIVSRNLALAQEGDFDLGDAGAANYLIRLFGNATNLAFRPVLRDEMGGIPLVAVAYWISGISLVVCLVHAVRTLWSTTVDEYSSWLAMLFVVSLVTISANPLVQPRYQLFFVVLMLPQVLSAYSAGSIIKTYLIVILFSLLAAGGYVLSGIGLPSPYGVGQMSALL